MKHRYLLVLSIFSLATQSHAGAGASGRPNVVLIITDDQGYGDLSCHGNPWLKTPELDRLASESCRLTNFHVSPTCAPTRAALMTGRFCNRTGVWHTVMGRSLLRTNEQTMADLFQQAGYATAIFGKWHLGDNHGLHPRQRGFGHAVVHGGGGVGQTPDFWGNDYFDDTYLVNGRPRRFEGYCTDVWFDQALGFIEQNKDRPFFVYLSTNAPHGPYNVDQRYAQPYAGNPDVLNPNFYGMIANIDENVGRFDRRLTELGLRDDTIFIFMTDNGTSAGYDPGTGKGYNAGMRGRKASHYDGGHRTPFFIRWPAALSADRDLDRLAAHVDVLPTLADLCSIERRGGRPLDGRSLAPLLRNESSEWPDRVLVVDNQRENYPQRFKEYAVMTDRWRLCGNGPLVELYDMPNDPGQATDVSGGHPEVVERLREAYAAWWNAQEADLVQPQPIIIGANDKVEKLTAHDWCSYDAGLVWNQDQIKSGPRAHGAWFIDVAQEGEYEVRLRRWPVEVNKRVNESLPIQVAHAEALVGGQLTRGELSASGEEAVLSLQLPAGPTLLRAEFLSDSGESIGVYYAYLRKR